MPYALLFSWDKNNETFYRSTWHTQAHRAFLYSVSLETWNGTRSRGRYNIPFCKTALSVYLGLRPAWLAGHLLLLLGPEYQRYNLHILWLVLFYYPFSHPVASGACLWLPYYSVMSYPVSRSLQILLMAWIPETSCQQGISFWRLWVLISHHLADALPEDCLMAVVFCWFWLCLLGYALKLLLKGVISLYYHVDIAGHAFRLLLICGIPRTFEFFQL